MINSFQIILIIKFQPRSKSSLSNLGRVMERKDAHWLDDQIHFDFIINLVFFTKQVLKRTTWNHDSNWKSSWQEVIRILWSNMTKFLILTPQYQSFSPFRTSFILLSIGLKKKGFKNTNTFGETRTLDFGWERLLINDHHAVITILINFLERHLAQGS